MQFSKQATRGHLFVGAILVLISLGYLITNLIIPKHLFSILIFFFGVWGGVELGRYLEYTLSKSRE